METEDYRFPDVRLGLTRKVTVGGFDLYLTVNTLPDGSPGEVFVKLGKQGSTLSGLMQGWAITVSAALQRGVRWQELSEKYQQMRFEPSDHAYTSLLDAAARNIDDMIPELREAMRERLGQQVLDFGGTSEL